MKEIFRIFDNYDSRMRPYIGQQLNVTGPVEFIKNITICKQLFNLIKANIYVGSISRLNQEDMRYDMDVFFRQFWNDPRLDLTKFTDKTTTVDETLLSKLWIPDLIFANGVGSSRHHVVRRNALFRLVSSVFEMLT